MFDCVPKRPLLPAKKKVTNYCITIEFCIILKIFPYICFPFRRIVKFCSDCFRQFFFFFSFGRQKKWLLVTLAGGRLIQ